MLHCTSVPAQQPGYAIRTCTRAARQDFAARPQDPLYEKDGRVSRLASNFVDDCSKWLRPSCPLVLLPTSRWVTQWVSLLRGLGVWIGWMLATSVVGGHGRSWGWMHDGFPRAGPGRRVNLDRAIGPNGSSAPPAAVPVFREPEAAISALGRSLVAVVQPTRRTLRVQPPCAAIVGRSPAQLHGLRRPVSSQPSSAGPCGGPSTRPSGRKAAPSLSTTCCRRGASTGV